MKITIEGPNELSDSDLEQIVDIWSTIKTRAMYLIVSCKYKFSINFLLIWGGGGEHTLLGSMQINPWHGIHYLQAMSFILSIGP